MKAGKRGTVAARELAWIVWRKRVPWRIQSVDFYELKPAREENPRILPCPRQELQIFGALFRPAVAKIPPQDFRNNAVDLFCSPYKLGIAMRIPNEALPLYQRESETPADARENTAKPVSGVAQTRSALSNPLSSQARSGTKDDALDEGNRGAMQSGRRNRDQPDERRREERRKANQPIMLDTRTTRSRRKSTRTPTINFKI